jgi:hypothetical protein
MTMVKPVKLQAIRSIGKSITSGRTYIGYPVDNKYSVETNFGAMKNYDPSNFRVKDQ